MRTLTLFFLLLAPLAGLRAQEDDDRLLVVASASIFADMAEVISGGLVEVTTVVPIGGDPHIYEPAPADVRLVARANLILVNGLTFEGWMNELIENSGTSAESVLITAGIGAIESEEYINSSDPHAWMTAANGQIYAANIRDALIRLDPEHAEEYRFNAGLYVRQLQDLDRELQREIARVPAAQRVLITSHDAFRYFGRHYGIRVEAALGTSTDAEVQTDDVNRLTNIIRTTGVPAIFVESTVNPKLIRQLATDNDVIIGGSLYADSLADPDHPAGTYVGMLRYNTNTIVEALLGNREDSGVGLGPDARQQGILLAIILAVMLGAFFFMVNRLNRSV